MPNWRAVDIRLLRWVSEAKGEVIGRGPRCVSMNKVVVTSQTNESKLSATEVQKAMCNRPSRMMLMNAGVSVNAKMEGG